MKTHLYSPPACSPCFGFPWQRGHRPRAVCCARFLRRPGPDYNNDGIPDDQQYGQVGLPRRRRRAVLRSRYHRAGGDPGWLRLLRSAPHAL